MRQDDLSTFTVPGPNASRVWRIGHALECARTVENHVIIEGGRGAKVGLELAPGHPSGWRGRQHESASSRAQQRRPHDQPADRYDIDARHRGRATWSHPGERDRPGVSVSASLPASALASMLPLALPLASRR
jgi:hypothetical protein